MLEKSQQIQEDLYALPYHWFHKPQTVSGRIMFGYYALCLEKLSRYSSDQQKHLRVLDAGCGDGRFLKALKDAGISDLYGVDYSKGALDFARLMLPSVSFLKADLTNKTPFEDNFFDMVFLIETLEHIIPKEIPALSRELSRILKPDGIVVITVPSDYTTPRPGGKHYQHFSPRSITASLEPHLKVVEVGGQDKTGFHFLKVFYKFMDNRYWQVKPFMKRYNLSIWPRYFNRAKYPRARRLIAVFRKEA